MMADVPAEEQGADIATADIGPGRSWPGDRMPTRDRMTMPET